LFPIRKLIHPLRQKSEMVNHLINPAP